MIKDVFYVRSFFHLSHKTVHMESIFCKILILHIIVFIFPVIMRQNPGSRSIPPGSTARTFRRRSFSPLLCRLILLYALTHHGLFTIFNPYLYLLLFDFSNAFKCCQPNSCPGTVLFTYIQPPISFKPDTCIHTTSGSAPRSSGNVNTR